MAQMTDKQRQESTEPALIGGWRGDRPSQATHGWTDSEQVLAAVVALLIYEDCRARNQPRACLNAIEDALTALRLARAALRHECGLPQD
jgi:hypothetical protein